MKILLSLLAFAPIAAHAAPRLDEACSGSETLQVGTQAPRTLPYALTFHADLLAGTYCYDRCTANETYPIAQRHAVPIRLADVSWPSQQRWITFDPRTGMLADHQVMTLGVMGRIERDAHAKCAPASPLAVPAIKP
ncbi:MULTISPECIES: hypothetical protein [unclassified Sphingomonas]|uniref:hypothetical protein n=1 Tax=Novosphingobium rhizosphaerae TaxID=1551649 RepID=UPI0015C866DD